MIVVWELGPGAEGTFVVAVEVFPDSVLAVDEKAAAREVMRIVETFDPRVDTDVVLVVADVGGDDDDDDDRMMAEVVVVLVAERGGFIVADEVFSNSVRAAVDREVAVFEAVFITELFDSNIDEERTPAVVDLSFGDESERDSFVVAVIAAVVADGEMIVPLVVVPEREDKTAVAVEVFSSSVGLLLIVVAADDGDDNGDDDEAIVVVFVPDTEDGVLVPVELSSNSRGAEDREIVVGEDAFTAETFDSRVDENVTLPVVDVSCIDESDWESFVVGVVRETVVDDDMVIV